MLISAELSPAARAKATARRKAIYEELHPETRSTSAGGDGRRKATRRQVGDELAERFTAETAATTGRSERAVQRDAERGESIAAAALDKLQGTPLDTGAYLDKLKGVPEPEQAARVENDLWAAAEPTASAPPPAQRKPAQSAEREAWLEAGRRWYTEGKPAWR